MVGSVNPLVREAAWANLDKDISSTYNVPAPMPDYARNPDLITGNQKMSSDYRRQQREVQRQNAAEGLTFGQELMNFFFTPFAPATPGNPLSFDETRRPYESRDSKIRNPYKPAPAVPATPTPAVPMVVNGHMPGGDMDALARLTSAVPPTVQQQQTRIPEAAEISADPMGINSLPNTPGYTPLPTVDNGGLVEVTNGLGQTQYMTQAEAEGYQGSQFLNKEGGAPPPKSDFTTAQKFELGFQGLEALTGLFNAYQGYRATKLAEDQFELAEDTTRANFSNMATTINNEYRDRETLRSMQSGQRLPQAKQSAQDFVNEFGVSGKI